MRPSSTNMNNFASRLLSWLIDPSSQITSDNNRLIARVLSSLTLFLTVMLFFAAINQIPAGNIAFILSFVAYIFSRTRYYQIGGLLTVTALVIPPVISVLSFDAEVIAQQWRVASSLSWLVIVLVFISLWAKGWVTGVATAIAVGLVLSLLLIRPEANTPDIGLLASLFGISGGLLALAAGLRNYYLRQVDEQKATLQTQQLQLQKRSQRYRDLVENISDIIYRINIEGYFTYVSPSAVLITGYTEEQLTGMHFTELVEPASRQRLIDFYKEQIKTRQLETVINFPVITANGSIRHVEQKTSLRFDEAGNPNGFQSVVRDNTERKLAEDKLQALYSVMAQPNLTIDEQLTQALKIGTEILGLKLGIISQIQGDTYTVLYGHSPDDSLQAGQTFDFKQTYCDMAYQVDSLLVIEHMAESDYRGHPCYTTFGLETYIGIPLKVSGERFGTLNFSSPSARIQAFSGVDQDFFVLMGQWVSTMLERKLAESRLRTSEASLRSILDNSPAIITRANRECFIEFTRVPGVEPALLETVIGQNFLDFMPEEFHDLARQSIKRVFNEKVTVQYETSSIDPRDGSIHWYVTSVAPIIEDDEVVSALLVNNDITERKQLEEKIHTSEKIYRSTASNVPGIMFQCLPEYDVWTMLFISDYVEELTGYPASDFTTRQREFGSLIHPEDGTQVNQAIENAIARAEPWAVEYRITHKDGRTVWLLEHGQVLDKDADEQILVGMMSDITERIRSETALKQRDDVLQAVAASSAELLQQGDWKQSVPQVLEVLGKGTGVSRTFIFKTHPESPEGEVIVSMPFEWVTEGVQPDIDNPIMQNLPLSDIAPRWAELAMQKQVISGFKKDFIEEEQMLLNEDVVFILIIPIFVDGMLWGAIGFDDCDGTHEWINVEIELLQSVADNIGAAIERQRRERLLHQREAILSAVAYSSEQLLQYTNWEDAIDTILARLGEETDASRVYIFQRHMDSPDDVAIVSQRYEWVADGIKPEIDNPELQDFPMGEVFPGWVANVSQRKSVYSFADDFAPGSMAREVINEQGIQSVLVMPIWVNNTWWGVIGFDECTGTRVWEQTEIDALQSAINNLSATIERQLSDAQLREAYALLDQAQSIGQMGNWEWDVRTGDLYWSDEIYRINNLEPGSIPATYEGWISFIHPDDRGMVQKAVEEALGGTPYDIESQIVWPDGTIRYAQNRGAVLFDENGQPLKMRGITLDITERKLAEQQVQTQNESLVKANRELAVTRKQAETASKLKSQFLATMSHELRTPLNAVIGYAQLQLAGMVGELTDEQYGFQERILANAQHLLMLINEVLDLSKIEAGRLELVQKPFNLRHCLTGIVQQNRILADDKGLAFELNFDDRLPETIVGDEGRIKQIIINLVSNAIKFTDAGSVTIDTVLYNKDSWRITVTDTGIGIAPHLQETVFDEFRQAENGLERGGTGLGLAIVRKLVLMMGGNIRLNSEVGKGSAFIITFPIITKITQETEIVEA